RIKRSDSRIAMVMDPGADSYRGTRAPSPRPRWPRPAPRPRRPVALGGRARWRRPGARGRRLAGWGRRGPWWMVRDLATPWDGTPSSSFLNDGERLAFADETNTEVVLDAVVHRLAGHVRVLAGTGLRPHERGRPHRRGGRPRSYTVRDGVAMVRPRGFEPLAF